MNIKKVLITGVGNISSEGATLKLNSKASLNGGIETDTIWVSWDRIGKALFGNQYQDGLEVPDMQILRGENQQSEE